MAGVYDEEILPLWGQRFARMIMRDLDLPSKANVLDVGCTTGYEALEIARRSEDCRVIALESASPMLDVARRKAGDLSHKRIFFRTENVRDKLAFAEDVFDLVFCNVRILEFADPPAMLREFARVCRVGGKIIVTLPLRGTWTEFHDIYREVLTKHDKPDMLQRLEEHIQKLPEPEKAIGWMEAAGLRNVDLEVEEFQLLFKSSREFFFAPVIEFGPLPGWKEIAGKGEEMQQVFWHIKEAIDTYFTGRAFQVTVKAACLRGGKGAQQQDATAEVAEADMEVVEEVEEIEEIEEIESTPPPAPEKKEKLLEEEEEEEPE